jgi:mannose-6-phosphate isomerase
MGTHPTNPSKIYGSDQLLSAYLADKKALLGSAKDFKPPFDGKKAEEGHVPFLFKILCANQGKYFNDCGWWSRC